ncbi:hypothetical protein HDU79_010096, partial [Rhizoclosmatium sp. JEL0117]
MGWMFILDRKDPTTIIYSRNAYFHEKAVHPSQLEGKPHEILPLMNWSDHNEDVAAEDSIPLPLGCTVAEVEEAASDTSPIKPIPVPIKEMPTTPPSPSSSTTFKEFYTPMSQTSPSTPTINDDEDYIPTTPTPTFQPTTRPTRNAPRQQYDAASGKYY